MDPSDADVLACLMRVVDGDIGSLAELAAIGNSRVFEAYRRMNSPTIVVPREAVVSVLSGLIARSVTPEVARSWAFLVRHGYLGVWHRTTVENDANGVVERAEATVWGDQLSIDWESEFEDPMNEATCRLDEIGDLIDGVVSDEEIRKFLQELSG